MDILEFEALKASLLSGYPKSFFEMVQASESDSGAKRILVTGGSGLVGEAVRWVIENEDDPRFGKRQDETWIFLTSKDGDLR